MNGSAELRQLAHLLRIGADVTRDIALIRQMDVSTLERLANDALDIADELDALAASSRKPSVGSA